MLLGKRKYVEIQAINIENTAFSEYRWLTDSNKIDVEYTKSFVMLTDEELEKVNDIDKIYMGHILH